MSQPEYVKHSKHDEYRDAVAEMIVGSDGAVRLPDVRLCVRGGGRCEVAGVEVAKIGIWGVAIQPDDITNRDGEIQMWDCEVILIPRRKFRKGFRGIRADQMLTSHRLGDPAAFEEQIFGEPVPSKDDNA